MIKYSRNIVLLMILFVLCGNVLAVEEVNLELSWGHLKFSSEAELLSADLCFPDCVSGNKQVAGKHQLLGQLTGQNKASAKPLLGFAGIQTLGYELNQTEDSGFIRLAYTSATTGQSINWQVSKDRNLLVLELSAPTVINVDSGLLPETDVYGIGPALEAARYPFLSADGITVLGLDADAEDLPSSQQWAGFRNRFWGMMFSGMEVISPLVGENVTRPQLRLEQAAGNLPIRIYLGPLEPAVLSKVDPQLKDILFASIWFWLRWISFGLYSVLGWIHVLIPSWGLAIMAMSISVKLLMTPLHRIADRWQHEVDAVEARMAPVIRRIKKDYKGEAQANKILALHKSEGVGMFYKLKSLLGVAILIPVFIGAFDMLAENIHLAGESFLWVVNLSRTDAIAQLPFTVPFFGNQLNLLPFLMTGLSMWSSWLHNPPALDAEAKAKQTRHLLLMALLFFALFYTFPAGMVLYWTTNNLISVIRDLYKALYKRKHSPIEEV